MNSRSLLAALVTAVVALSCSGFAFADDQWPELPYEPCFRVERVLSPSDICSAGGYNVFGLAVNVHGTIVGSAVCGLAGQNRAFIWRMNQPFEWIPLPSGTTRSWASQINDDGWVAGRFENSSIGGHAFVWNEQTGEIHLIGSPFGPGLVEPMGINAAGVVVGTITVLTHTPPLQGFIWEAGILTLLQDLYDFKGRLHIPTDISDDGAITGYFPGGPGGLQLARPFLIMQDKLIEFDRPHPGGWQGTVAWEHLPRDRFVAEATNHPDFPQEYSTIVIGDASGYLKALERPEHYRRIAPVRTNAAGDIVGVASIVGGGFEAIIVRNNTILPLRSLQIPESVPEGTGIAAYGLSELGHIASGSYHLVPAPPPLGDLSRNCRRDIQDLLLLLGQWGPGSGPADLNGDGEVDIRDLLMLLSFIANDQSL